MGKVILVCGKICSGKSHYSKAIKESLNAVIISPDEATYELINNEQGEFYNVFSERLNKYLTRKVGEIARAGANVIFERGLWAHKDRKEIREYYKNSGIDCEIHYVCVDDETWKQNITDLRVPIYKNFPNILHSVNAKSNILLSWTHYKTLLQVLDKEARAWYEQEAIQQTWSVRTLQRNISSQYYYRLLKSQVKEPVIEEMKNVNENHYLMNKLEFIKNPVIAEFLGYSLDDSFTETELESSIINNIQKFLMELRKRICFCCETTTYSN
jgi:predicted nuclease of restriction endonuclease-like (RecB) superfamily